MYPSFNCSATNFFSIEILGLLIGHCYTKVSWAIKHQLDSEVGYLWIPVEQWLLKLRVWYTSGNCDLHAPFLMDHDVIKEGSVICREDNTHVLQNISFPWVIGSIGYNRLNDTYLYFHPNPSSVLDGWSFLSLILFLPPCWLTDWFEFACGKWRPSFSVRTVVSAPMSTSPSMGCPSKNIVNIGK